MAEIGFYHLTRTTLEQALPRLLEKVLASDLRAVLRAGSAERLDLLDRHLWTYAPDSFLPHGTAADGFAEDQPVWLTTGTDRPNRAQVLLLADGADPEIAGFERVIDLFDGNDPQAVAAARERWKARRAEGHRLVYWRQDERGRWVRQQETGGTPSAGEDGSL
ncbi:DNA polymerase III subunit chi [Geminicoccaceae bacterium 1502E]|nr:DNA polymerase III subunit chi [Geminicoccaceae bacterium 1502E]